MSKTQNNKRTFIRAILASTLIFATVFSITNWAERHIWLSQNYTRSTNHNMQASGYTYTGKAYCKSYFYVNTRWEAEVDEEVSTIKSTLEYYTWDFSINTGDIYNYKASDRKYNSMWVEDPYYIWDATSDTSKYILNMWLYKGTSTTDIPAYFTDFRFSLINNWLVSRTTWVFLDFNGVTPKDDTDVYDGATQMESIATNSKRWAKIIFVPEPCIFDGPITTSATYNSTEDASLQRHNQTTRGFTAWSQLKNEFSLNSGYTYTSDGIRAGKPVTIETFEKTSYYLPASVDDRRTVDSWLFLKIKEPDAINTLAFHQTYWFATGQGPTTGTIPTLSNLTADYTGRNTTNQRWVNPTTIKLYLNATFTDKTDRDDSGSTCLVVFSGSDISLDSSAYGTSWNNNALWYDITVSKATILSNVSSQCGISNAEYKRETSSSIYRDARDYNHSLKISHHGNTRTSPNQIYWTESSCSDGVCAWAYAAGSTGYSFNQETADPELLWSINNQTLVNGATAGNANYTYNVPISTDEFNFTGTDERAGINSGTFYIAITGYSSTEKSSQNRGNGQPAQISGTLTASWPNNNLSLFAISSVWDRSDYTGMIETLVSQLSMNTGKQYDIAISVEDFVGNSTSRIYSFRTPTRPNKPCGGPNNTCTAPVVKSEMSKHRISEDSDAGVGTYNLIDDIRTGSIAWATYYDYETYYPDAKELISKFSYKSGDSLYDSNQSMILTAYNDNNVANDVITLTGLEFIYNNSDSYITGSLFLSKNGQAVSGYLTTTFTFEVLATNIYWVTGIVTYHIGVIPSCAESAGCMEKTYIYFGPTLTDAQALETTAINNETTENYRYNHWFAQLIQTTSGFYFSGLDVNYNSVALYCAGSGTDLLIQQTGASGPSYDNPSGYPNTDAGLDATYLYSGAWFTVTGDVITQFGVTGALKVEYETTLQDNGRQQMTINIIRPLTGQFQYSICEFTGDAGQASQVTGFFGCPISNSSHNRTWDVNRTRLESGENFIITGRIEGGWISGNRDGYYYNGTLWNTYAGNNGIRSDYRNTGNINIYHGGWKRTYTQTGHSHSESNTSGTVIYTIENRTGLTKTMTQEVYWIDNVVPVLSTGFSNLVPNRQIDLNLTSSNVGQLSNSQVSELTGDDEFKLLAFSWNRDPVLYTTAGYPNTLTTWGYLNDTVYNDYKMEHNITFGGQWTGYIVFRDRAGNTWAIYIEVDQLQSMKEFTIIARPAFRGSPTYSITTGDFWLRELSGSTRVENYNSNINSWTDEKVDLNINGTGLINVISPTSGKTYLVALKAPGQLSIGFTGIYNDDITTFDFTDTGNSNLTINDGIYKSLQYQDIVYMKPGDISATNTGNYDLINNSDFGLLNNSLSRGVPWESLNPIYDFDINSTISAIEQAIVIQLYMQKGFIGWLDHNNVIPMEDFVENF